MKLVFVLLILALAGPQACLGNLDACRGVDGFVLPPENENSYITYEYESDPVTDECLSVRVTCNATLLPTSRLTNRVWYIDANKPGDGIGYKNNIIQVYNIQCPPGNPLHLFPQFVDTEADSNGACVGFDFITVSVPGEDFDFIELCGGEEDRISHPLYNDLLGILVEGGNATVTFCSNDNFDDNQGFVIRATCVDPSISCLPGCVDFNEVRETGPGLDFINRVLGPHPTPERVNILHKRSEPQKQVPWRVNHVVKLKQEGELHRYKRFALNDLFDFTLLEGQTVTYLNNTLTIDFNNGSTQTFEVTWLVAFNDLLGTRIYDVNLPSKLRISGPGKIEVYGDIALVDYTIEDLSALVVPSIEVSQLIEIIADYTYFNYILPYPVICPLPADDILTFPLPFASSFDDRYRQVYNLGFLQEDIQSGVCRRAVRLDLVPSRQSQIEKDIFDFCQFFYYSCNPLLQIICMELLDLDPQSG